MKPLLGACASNPLGRLLVLVLFAVLAAGFASGDALDDALALEGLAREDLGWKPRGYWSRFPADIPYKLRHFDALLERPLATVTFARTAYAVAREQLGPEALATVPGASAGALHRAVHMLGIERKFGGFRAYSANLQAPQSDLVEALLAVHTAAGRATRFHSFGQDSPYPNYRAELEQLAAPVPDAVRKPLARLILNLLDAQRWIDLAFRNVPPAARLDLQRRLDLGVELTDALEYFPRLDDAARLLDEASLWYGGMKTVAALELARHELAAAGAVPEFGFDWPGPLGWIRFRGAGANHVDGDDSFLIVDLGGDDTYRGGVAAPAPGRGLSALLDMGGNDAYVGDEGPSQGAGLGGVGVLLDVAGDDEYRAVQCAQGFGQLGLGVLADLGGKDRYVARYSAQGSAILGVGLLLEAGGNDVYRIESDGQGFGGAGGVGTLADRAGDDRYEAVRDPKVTGRPSYHSELGIAVSNAQGVGMGRRGDGADGHSWAGGLGQLVDVEGNDEYISGNWSMGTGYWFGTGILHDGAGDDVYRGVAWSQGTGAHFAIGALIDEAGNDRHLIDEPGRNSLAFGHDFSVALLINLGGDDAYEAVGDGLGLSINRSVAILLDVGGSDTYRARSARRPGSARYDERLGNRSGESTYFAEASSLGMFLDVGGKDRYHQVDGENDAVWLDPEDSPNRDVRNFSIGVDRAAGAVSLIPRPEKPPSRPSR